jgi:hypothetical protein
VGSKSLPNLKRERFEATRQSPVGRKPKANWLTKSAVSPVAYSSAPSSGPSRVLNPVRRTSVRQPSLAAARTATKRGVRCSVHCTARLRAAGSACAPYTANGEAHQSDCERRRLGTRMFHKWGSVGRSPPPPPPPPPSRA